MPAATFDIAIADIADAAADAAADDGIVGSGTIGHFFVSVRLRMLDIEKLVYGVDVVDVFAASASPLLSAGLLPLLLLPLVLPDASHVFAADGLLFVVANVVDAVVVGVAPSLDASVGDFGGLSRESGLWLKDPPIG